jgi:ABC-type sugar transport system ATPase subunit
MALSGGNQQKVILSRWLARSPRVLLLDDPTRGVDVAAKAEIHGRIADAARTGMAVVMASSDLPELLRTCDRIVVLHQGTIAGELGHAEATEQAVMALATNLHASSLPGGSR